MLALGTIVYFRDEEGFQIRKNPLGKMLKTLEPLGTPVHIIAQAWEPEWVQFFRNTYKNITIDEFEKPLGPAGARQVLFRKYLYETDIDFLFQFDSDVVLADVYGILGLLEIAQKAPERLQGYDLIQGICPQFVGFKKYNIDNQELVEKNFTFGTGTRQSSPIYLLRNLKKFYDTEIYPIDDYVKGEYSFEDIHFFMELMVKNFKVVTCNQLIYTIKDGNKTTIKDQDGHEERNLKKENRHKEYRKNIEWFKLGTEAEAKKFFREYNKSFERPPVQRLTPHKFTEYELKFKSRTKNA